MTDYLNFDSARYLLVRNVNESVKERFKLLLEDKHLYQSVVSVDFSEVFSKLAERVLTADDTRRFEYFAQELYKEPLIPSEQQVLSEVLLPGDRRLPKLILFLQNVKLYCSVCKGRETFIPAAYVDVTYKTAKRHSDDHRIALHPPRFQLIALAYQCENCRSLPVSFLIQRKEWKLTMSGRSPFEDVVLPKYIPQPEEWLLSGAIVAAQTGNVLAGLFYLRSFVEQFARRQTGIRDKQTGEVILDAYQATLPEKIRDHMPSLKSWYEQLSGPIHAATEDAELFREAYDAILNHFDFRRIYKVPEVAVTTTEGATAAPTGESKK